MIVTSPSLSSSGLILSSLRICLPSTTTLTSAAAGGRLVALLGQLALQLAHLLLDLLRLLHQVAETLHLVRGLRGPGARCTSPSKNSMARSIMGFTSVGARAASGLVAVERRCTSDRSARPNARSSSSRTIGAMLRRVDDRAVQVVHRQHQRAAGEAGEAALLEERAQHALAAVDRGDRRAPARLDVGVEHGVAGRRRLGAGERGGGRCRRRAAAAGATARGADGAGATARGGARATRRAGGARPRPAARAHRASARASAARARRRERRGRRGTRRAAPGAQAAAAARRSGAPASRRSSSSSRAISVATDSAGSSVTICSTAASRCTIGCGESRSGHWHSAAMRTRRSRSAWLQLAALRDQSREVLAARGDQLAAALGVDLHHQHAAEVLGQPFGQVARVHALVERAVQLLQRALRVARA